MSTASATAFSAWAVLSVLFLIFLIHHIWCYDRFKCLRWSAGHQPATFKRVMTYTYLVTIPLLSFYSIGMTVIKYREGFAVMPGNTAIPVPINQYRPENRDWVLPLQFVFSIAWAFEQVTHLEELAFWLYLLHQNPEKEEWFSSWEYRLWYLGSLAAIVGMPLTAIITRTNLETVDAYLFVVGSCGSGLTTIATLYVLWRFPKFIKHVKAEGAEPTVVVRLATFYQLNQVRVVFRFLFILPLLILAFDGIIGTTHTLNRNLFVADFLQMIAGIGCFVSSMFTLLIFFPRSIVRESGYKPKLASTAPNSPKSPPGSPYAQFLPPNVNGLTSHVVAYPNLTSGTMYATTAYTGVTGTSTWEIEDSVYTHSMYTPRDSMYDSPRYTAESADNLTGERRGSQASKMSRSRRASTYGGKHMDAHVEQETDEEERERTTAEGFYVSEVDGEERVPPYSRSQPSAHPNQPAEARLHQRSPFPHSLSSQQVVTLASRPPQDSSSSPPPSPPTAAAVSSPSPPRPTSPSTKRRTWGWEEQRPAPLAPNVRRNSLHVIASGLGATTVAVGPGGVGLGTNIGLHAPLTRPRPSSLHPYVMNFTSPIDFVDLASHNELPRAM